MSDVQQKRRERKEIFDVKASSLKNVIKLPENLPGRQVQKSDQINSDR